MGCASNLYHTGGLPIASGPGRQTSQKKVCGYFLQVLPLLNTML